MSNPADKPPTGRRTLAAQQSRDDVADLLWMLLKRRRMMRERVRRQRGILHDAAWDSYGMVCRQIYLVRCAIND